VHDQSRVDLAQLVAPTGPHKLITARLDQLAPTERRTVQDASVLGLTFRESALAKLTGLPPATLDAALSSLMHRGVVETQTDPRSPDLGHYRFPQGLVREGAYSTLSRKDRRARHLAAATHLEVEGDDEAVAAICRGTAEAANASGQTWHGACSWDTQLQEDFAS
jgi:predicted ATPase